MLILLHVESHIAKWSKRSTIMVGCFKTRENVIAAIYSYMEKYSDIQHTVKTRSAKPISELFQEESEDEIFAIFTFDDTECFDVGTEIMPAEVFKTEAL